MPCSNCGNLCSQGVKDGPAQNVAICDILPVVCSGTVPGIGEPIGQIVLSPSSVNTLTAQQLTDFETQIGQHVPFVDATAVNPGQINNILVDDGTVWDLDPPDASGERAHGVSFSDPFGSCPTTTIEIVDVQIVVTPTAGIGVATPAPVVWIGWLKDDGSYVGEGSDRQNFTIDVENRVTVNLQFSLSQVDIQNGQLLLAWNTKSESPPGSTTNYAIDFVGATVTYDATSCETADQSALPVVICSQEIDPTPATPELWQMDGGELTIGATSTANIPISTNTQMLSIYNPSTEILTIEFSSSDGQTHRQIVPPETSYSFGVPSAYYPLDPTLTSITNPGAGSVNIIWNSSTVAI